ncbi:MAG: SDR family oxidoreductase [Aquihabitans sp.]
MDVVIAGAHGKIARLLTRQLAARGDRVRGIIRNPEHRADVEADGAEPVVCDLETAHDAEVQTVVTGADAIVFAAGAGPGSGAARKWTVDHGAAKKLIDAAVATGVRRYVMVGAQGTDDPPQDDEVFSVYLRAKAQADQDLRDAALDHTIVRPTGLTDDPGAGSVHVARHVPRSQVSRADVAAVVAAVLADDATTGRTFELSSGPTPIADAAAAIAQLPSDT